MALLEDLLDQAAQALLAGDLSALATLTPRIESAALPQDRATATRRPAASRGTGFEPGFFP